MKKSRLILPAMLLALVVLLFISGAPTAQASTYGDFYYLHNNGNVIITGCTDSASGDLVIPATIDGYPVTTIDSYAFSHNHNLTSVTIPDSVNSIRYHAFYNSSIVSVNIPSSLTTIGSYAFSYSGLTSVTIPSTVTVIGDGAFSGCNLTSITIPGSVTTIGNSAFYDCDKMTQVTIGNSVTTIGSNAFSRCGITSVNIPGSVTTIGDSAFSDCDKMTQVTIGNGVTTIGSDAFSRCGITSVNIPGSVTTLGDRVFESCASLTSATIGNGVTSIGDRAFYDCVKMTQVTIGNSVQTVESNAFRNCHALTAVYITDIAAWCEIEFADFYANPLYYANKLYLNGKLVTELVVPDSVAKIGNYVFYDYDDLTQVIIGNGVTSIGYGAFYSCDSLTQVVIGNSVTSIGSMAFNDCKALTRVNIPEGVTTINSSAFSGCSLTSITIPNSVTTIDRWAFSSCTALTGVYITDIAAWCEIDFASTDANPLSIAHNLYLNGKLVTKLEIPDGVTAIGNYTFVNCTSLISVTIPDSVTSIGDRAFIGCKAMTEVIIPDSVTTISSYAFYNCNALTRITIPNKVTIIGDSTFYNCTSMTQVSIGSSVTTIDRYAFYGCKALTSVIIPDSVTSIGDRAFNNCTRLTSVTIPDSVTSIGDREFSGCNALTEVTFKGDAPSIEDGTFSSVTATVYYPADNDTWTEEVQQDYGGNLTWVAYGNSSTDQEVPSYLGYEIRGEAVTITSCDTSATGELVIPNFIEGYPVTAIQNNAFGDCSGLTSITIPDSVTEIGEWAFSACTSLTSVTIGDGVVFIGNNAFRECAGLTSVTIGNSVEIIERGVFSLCTGLTSVTFPDSVTEIGNGIFYGCESLEKVAIGSGLTYIGDGAFTGCTALTDVYYSSTQEQFEQIYIGPFNEYMTLATIHLESVPGEDTCEHTYGPWEVTVPPSFYAIGWTESHCSLCGEVVNQIIPAAYAWIPQWNITVEDDFKLNFYLEISESIESTAIVKMIIGDKVETLPVSALERAEDFTYIATANISAAQMNENIIVMVINGNEIGYNGIYSVQQYCDTILSDESYSQYHALVKEMLNYGAMAQLYFNYDTDNLVNNDFADAGKTEVPNTAKTITVSDSMVNLDFYGASLVFRDRIAVRYYFTGNISGCSFTANGNTYAPTEKDGMYYVEIPDILPQDLDQQITLYVTDSEGSTLAVTYNPMNYIVRMNQKGSYALQNLIKALYNYHLAAKELAAA